MKSFLVIHFDREAEKNMARILPDGNSDMWFDPLRGTRSVVQSIVPGVGRKIMIGSAFITDMLRFSAICN